MENSEQSRNVRKRLTAEARRRIFACVSITAYDTLAELILRSVQLDPEVETAPRKNLRRQSDASSGPFRLKGNGMVTDDESQDHLPQAECVLRLMGHVICCGPGAMVLCDFEGEGHICRGGEIGLDRKARLCRRCGHGIHLQFGLWWRG
jgi:hypothetical protein